MAKTTEKLKGCIYSNFCKDKNLCCHFCNDKRCWRRCEDNLETCLYRCELPSPPEVEEDDKNINTDKLKEV